MKIFTCIVSLISITNIYAQDASDTLRYNNLYHYLSSNLNRDVSGYTVRSLADTIELIQVNFRNVTDGKSIWKQSEITDYWRSNKLQLPTTLFIATLMNRPKEPQADVLAELKKRRNNDIKDLEADGYIIQKECLHQ